MKKQSKGFLNRYIFDTNLTFDARVFNIACSAGVVALLVSFVGHLVEYSSVTLLIVKGIMILSAVLIFILANKYDKHKLCSMAVMVGFCDVFFPVLFFENGGINGGIAAYFVLTVILIVLLSHGKTFILMISIHMIIIVACYLTNRYHPDLVVELDLFQRYADNIMSVIIAGLFIAISIKGLSSLFIREQKTAEAASKAKGDFLAQMSHEMRTPMNAIIGITTLLQESDDIAAHKNGIMKIEEASNHLLGVINDILDMSKIEADKMELSNKPFAFRRMIDNTVSMIRFSSNAKEQTLAVKVDPNIPQYLNADRQRLAQILTNLLSNSIKFTPPHGEINLTATYMGEEGEGKTRIMFSVKDNGIGITEEARGRLFNAFEQANNSTTREYGGTGLGLAICKRIVEMMEGKIWVESEPNVGSTFIFDILAETAEQPAEEEVSSEDCVNKFVGRKILLAEDVEINQDIVLMLLKPTGVSIDCASNGSEAVEKYTANPDDYDLILMDIQMPIMDGYSATRAIRNSGRENARSIPIIALSANVFKEDIDKAMRAGMNDYLGKPLVVNNLLAKLNHLMDLPR
jgi:signal transduction histidine kinase/ActR/RegA family two-component response regulator